MAWSRGTRLRIAAGLAVTLAASAGTVLLASGSAGAAPNPSTVRIRTGAAPVLEFLAGEGTLNEVVVRDNSSGFEVEDRAAPIRLNVNSVGCFLANAYKVQCPRIPDLTLEVELKDGGDFYGGILSDIPATVRGDVGEDRLWGGGGKDFLDGGWDDDEVRGFAGPDTVAGNYGDDTVYGNAGDDTVSGGFGDDLLRGGDDKDNIGGQHGDDTLMGEEGDDRLHGGLDDDRMLGQDGNDTLSDQFGVNTADGGAGNDTFFLMGTTGAAYQGSTDYHGGQGVDTIDYTDAAGPYHVSLDDRANDRRVQGEPDEVPDNVHADVENVIGTRFGDKIVGSEAPNDLAGGDGKDHLEGKGGDDYLDAQHGYDEKLIGGDGVDTCVGWDLYEPEGCERL